MPGCVDERSGLLKLALMSVLDEMTSILSWSWRKRLAFHHRPSILEVSQGSGVQPHARCVCMIDVGASRTKGPNGVSDPRPPDQLANFICSCTAIKCVALHGIIENSALYAQHQTYRLRRSRKRAVCCWGS